MDNPLVSILINNYNYGRFLKEAIDSALNQTYSHVEVVVVDDGSTDESRDIIENYGDRIKAILKENGGQASAFNAGFAASHGEIICFLDADDIFKTEKVLEVVKTFEDSQEISWYFHSLEYVSHESRENLEKGSLPSIEETDFSGKYDLRSSIKKGKLSGCLPFELSTATSGACFDRLLLAEILPMPEEIRITSDDYIKYVALGISQGFISFKKLAQQRIHGSNAYTFKPNNTELIVKTLSLTAYWVRKKYPELSRFTNNLLSLGIDFYWRGGKTESTLSQFIGSYLSLTSFSEKFLIYAKALYYRLQS